MIGAVMAVVISDQGRGMGAHQAADPATIPYDR
jgi:hypothetical protein